MAAPGDTVGVEEVVVTAQKRAERLQDVPLAVTAITAERIQNSGVVNTLQLGEVVAGVVTNLKTLNSSPYLRGLGVGTSQPGLESSVASYVDGVYLPNPISSSFNLNSIERIEVLRGPQGTLFGRNASAGVIALHTRDPSSSPALKADVSYDSYETLVGRLYASGPVAPGLSANMSLYTYNQREGYGRIPALDKPFRYEDSVNARAKLLWDIAPGTDLLLTGWYVHTWSDIGISRIYPGSVATGGYACSTCGFFDATGLTPSSGKGTSYGGSAKFDHDLSFATLTNIVAYQVAKPYFFTDADNQPAPVQNVSQSSRQETITDEVQLVSDGDGRLSWTAGLYFLHDSIDFSQVATGTSVPAGSVTRSKLKTDSFAPYGQATFTLTDATNVTAGLRYTIDRRQRDGVRGSLTLLTPVPSASATFKEFSWRLAIDHQFSPDIMGYASYSRGFKAGLLNVAELTGPPVKPEILDAYEAGLKTEFLDRRLLVNAALFYYSVDGLQLRALAPGQLILVVVTNAAKAEGYGLDVDFDAALTDRLGVTGGFEVLDAEFTDFSSATLSTPRPPAVGGNLTFLGDAVGNRLPYAARFSGNVGVRYKVPLASGAELKFSGNYSYRSRIFFEPDPRLSQKPYGLLNASVTWVSPGERWQISAWGRNLADKEYVATAAVANATVSNFAPGAPRTVGVTLGVDF